MSENSKNVEKPQVIDDTLNSMCSWIQDSSQFKSNENDHMLLSMLDSWQPRALFLDLPNTNKDNLEKSSDRLMNNALMEFTDEINDGSDVFIAQYITTNTKKKDHTEIQRCAMHMEMGPSTGDRDGMEQDVEELTKNQAKVMKKNFTLFKDGKPLRKGKIHMVNMGRERQGKVPMKFQLNYLSTNVPNVDSNEYHPNDKQRSLQPYVNKGNFRRTIERQRYQKPFLKDEDENNQQIDNNNEINHNRHHHYRNDERKEPLVSHSHDVEPVIHHPPTYQIEIHDNDDHKDTTDGEHNNEDRARHLHLQEHKPIMTLEKVDQAKVSQDKVDSANPLVEKVQAFEDFETPIIRHQTTTITTNRSPSVSESFDIPNRGKYDTFSLANNYPNQGFVRAYRYHSKRRSASLYEWPAPSGSFRMLKAD